MSSYDPNTLIKRLDPRSLNQTRSHFSNDKIKTLTKAKLQEYIASFFGRLGENHDLLQIVSPRSVNFNIDRSFDVASDPTQRKLQIAKYFTELRSIIPCILILDGGIVPSLQSVGLISDAYNQNGYWHGRYPIVRRIPVSIIVAARDVESADELSSVLSLLFNELRNVAGGSRIQGRSEEGETWVIFLPNEGVPSTGLTEVDIEGEPIEKIFYSELSMEVTYEDTIQIQQLLPTIQERGIAVNNEDVTKNNPPKIIMPSTISINDQVIVVIKGMGDQQRIAISNPNVATLSHNMVLTARAFGSASLKVIDPTRPPQERVLVSFPFTVV